MIARLCPNQAPPHADLRAPRVHWQLTPRSSVK